MLKELAHICNWASLNLIWVQTQLGQTHLMSPQLKTTKVGHDPSTNTQQTKGMFGQFFK